MTARVTLHDGWTVRAVGDVPDSIARRAIPATVPGCVHLDLMAAGLIPDPYLGENERLVTWIGRTDWRYETTFAWDGSGADDHVDLVAHATRSTRCARWLATSGGTGGLIS